MKTRSVELCKNLQELKLIKNELKKFKTILSLTDEYTSFIIKRDTYSLTLDIIKDEELFFIDKNNKFIVIKYFALRDENGKYLGVLETTQETSELRNLKGNKTLIDRRN